MIKKSMPSSKLYESKKVALRSRSSLIAYVLFFRYNTSKLKFTEFHFGSPIMRLLYVHDKPDLAMQLFMDEVNLF